MPSFSQFNSDDMFGATSGGNSDYWQTGHPNSGQHHVSDTTSPNVPRTNAFNGYLNQMGINNSCGVHRSSYGHMNSFPNPSSFSENESAVYPNGPLPTASQSTATTSTSATQPPSLPWSGRRSQSFGTFDQHWPAPSIENYMLVAQKEGYIVGTALENVKSKSQRNSCHSFHRISSHFKTRYGETDSKTKETYLHLGVRVPSKDHVSEIVGKGGSKIKTLREETGALIATPGEDEDHVFIIEAPPEIALRVARYLRMRADEITNSKATERRRGSGGGVTSIAPRVLLARGTIAVPSGLVGKIIGTQGSIITTIQKDTGTEIKSPPKEAERLPGATADFEISAFQSTSLKDEVQAKDRIRQAKQLICHLVMRQLERRPDNDDEPDSGRSGSETDDTAGASRGLDSNTPPETPSTIEWMWPEVIQMNREEAKQVIDRILGESKNKAKRPPASGKAPVSSQGCGKGESSPETPLRSVPSQYLNARRYSDSGRSGFDGDAMSYNHHTASRALFGGRHHSHTPGFRSDVASHLSGADHGSIESQSYHKQGRYAQQSEGNTSFHPVHHSPHRQNSHPTNGLGPNVSLGSLDRLYPSSVFDDETLNQNYQAAARIHGSHTMSNFVIGDAPISSQFNREMGEMNLGSEPDFMTSGNKVYPERDTLEWRRSAFVGGNGTFGISQFDDRSSLWNNGFVAGYPERTWQPPVDSRISSNAFYSSGHPHHHQGQINSAELQNGWVEQSPPCGIIGDRRKRNSPSPENSQK